MGETEGGVHEVGGGETGKGGVAEERADEGVFVLASYLLEDDRTLVEHGTVLFLNGHWFLLNHYFEYILHILFCCFLCKNMCCMAND